MPDKKEEWVVIRNCFWLQEADVLRSVLEGNGVEVLIPDENLLSAVPYYGTVLGGVRVMVQSKDLRRAREILKAMEIPDADLEDSDKDERE
jgi:Putative prokaryotic signal transducing protein